MTAPTNLKLDGLDFNSIKDNFKNFLKAQDRFKDFNFDSSGLNVLLDVLSYNTYYNSFYVNMVSNEAFLSTAQRRNSVVAAARSLNYTPRSTTSARIVANIAVTPTGTPASVLIPRFTTFSAVNDLGSYTFVNLEPITVYSNNSYVANNVTLTEGTYVDERYTVNLSDTEQRFIINNTDADTSTLRVRVQNSASDSTIRSFTKADSYVNLDSTSLVYFVEEIEDGYYELKFGNGAFGTSLLDGNIVLVEYLTSSGADGNDVSLLNFNASVSGVVSMSLSISQKSYGGDEKESVERIKFNAPKYYASQNRLITAEDYRTIILQQPNVQSAIAWGGEDNDPPVYGKVFVAVQPKIGLTLTETEKFNIETYSIKPKKMITMDVELVDPEYIYLLIEAAVKYDSTMNVLNVTNLNSLILEKVMTYKNQELSQFSKYFRLSKLSRVIDSSERSIQSSVVKVKMRKEVPVQLNLNASYIIDFANPIDDITSDRAVNHPYAAGNKVTSNAFYYNGYPNCFMEENGGIIRIYRLSGVDYIGVVADIGTVDYDTGRITLNTFKPEAFMDGGTTLKLTAIPAEQDILSLRTQIITIREEDVSISLIDDNAISLTRR